jgi:hypothetical protein
MSRLTGLLSSSVLGVAAVLGAIGSAQAAEPPACLDPERAFDPKADLSSLQLNSQLFRAWPIIVRAPASLISATKVPRRSSLRAMRSSSAGDSSFTGPRKRS